MLRTVFLLLALSSPECEEPTPGPGTSPLAQFHRKLSGAGDEQNRDGKTGKYVVEAIYCLESVGCFSLDAGKGLSLPGRVCSVNALKGRSDCVSKP